MADERQDVMISNKTPQLVWLVTKDESSNTNMDFQLRNTKITIEPVISYPVKQFLRLHPHPTIRHLESENMR